MICSRLGLLLLVLIRFLLAAGLLALVGDLGEIFHGSPLAVSALKWCSVHQDCWILPHYAVRASFSIGRWSARVCLPTRFSLLWPAAWVACSDKSRSSKSVEVRRIWEVYDESLSFIPPAFGEVFVLLLLLVMFLLLGVIWSFSAEVSLVRAFPPSGGPVPESGFRLGSWSCSVQVCSFR